MTPQRCWEAHEVGYAQWAPDPSKPAMSHWQHPQCTMATTDGAKAPAPCQQAAACGSWVYTANAIRTHTTLTQTMQHPPPMLTSNCSSGGRWPLWPQWYPRMTGHPPANTALPTPTPERGKTRQQANMSTDATNDVATAPSPTDPNVNQHPPPLLWATALRVDQVLTAMSTTPQMLPVPTPSCLPMKQWFLFLFSTYLACFKQ